MTGYVNVDVKELGCEEVEWNNLDKERERRSRLLSTR
jgi:hypothetical protein